MRDRRIPLALKLIALAMGLALTGALAAFELPLEGLLGLFLPVLGVAADAVIDGLEFVVLPVAFASLILPHLLKRRLQPSPGHSRPRSSEPRR